MYIAGWLAESIPIHRYSRYRWLRERIKPSTTRLSESAVRSICVERLRGQETKFLDKPGLSGDPSLVRRPHTSRLVPVVACRSQQSSIVQSCHRRSMIDDCQRENSGRFRLQHPSSSRVLSICSCTQVQQFLALIHEAACVLKWKAGQSVA